MEIADTRLDYIENYYRLVSLKFLDITQTYLDEDVLYEINKLEQMSNLTVINWPYSLPDYVPYKPKRNRRKKEALAIIDKAIMFATMAHSGQTRKGGKKPYILHPLEASVIAADIMNSLGKWDDNVICASLLHDTNEDSKINLETLEMIFNKKVADLVKAQSEDKSKEWKERKQHTINFLLRKTQRGIKIVSLADKLANMRAMKKDYEQVGDELWKRFTVTEKSEHAWYYTSLVNCFDELKETDAYKEYKALVESVFGK